MWLDRNEIPVYYSLWCRAEVRPVLEASACGSEDNHGHLASSKTQYREGSSSCFPRYSEYSDA